MEETRIAEDCGEVVLAYVMGWKCDLEGSVEWVCGGEVCCGVLTCG